VAGDQWLIASDGGKELLRLPFWYADGTLRSHAAIRNEAGKSRLLIFWGAMREPRNGKSVYSWDGEKIVETAPTVADQEVLSAMEARDDSGGLPGSVALRLIRDVASIVYYVLLVGATVFILIRRQKRSSPTKSEI
jgi:hypothetical protein